MPRRIGGPALSALLLLAEFPAAAQTCKPAEAARTPTQVAERIDHYRAEPRDPGTYRALAGLGDPQQAPDHLRDIYHDYYYYADSPQRRAMLAAMVPDQMPLSSEFWHLERGTCRIAYAARTGEARIARFGASHPYVRQWLRVQRAVFSTCRAERSWYAVDANAPREPQVQAAPPPAMPTGDPEIGRLQANDRAYQAASALFYRRDPAAARAFRHIAGTRSPHAHIARYMLLVLAARDLDSSVYDGTPEGRAELAARAQRARAAVRDARAILADPGLADIHGLTQGLIGFLGYWTGDAAVRAAQVDATMDALALPYRQIAGGGAARDRYRRADEDIDWLRRGFPDNAWWLTGDDPESLSASPALAARARRDPFAAWLLFPRSPFEVLPWAAAPRLYDDGWSLLRSHAGDQSGRESGRAWALVSASVAIRYEPRAWRQVDAFTRAAQGCPSNDRLAAVATRFYHQVRTALMYPAPTQDYRPRERQDGFALALAHVEAWPWRDSMHHRELVSDMLQFLVAEGRIGEARTLRNRLHPRGENYQSNGAALLLLAENEDQFAREIASMPDEAQPLVNLLPAGALGRLAARTDLPAELRARFARVAWARLYARQRRIPTGLDRLMRRLNPKITGGWLSRPGARPGSRRLLLDVLRSPGLNILITPHQRSTEPDAPRYYGQPGLVELDTREHSDNNWWCAWQSERHSLRASAVMYGAFFDGEDRWNRDPLAVAGTPAALRPLLRSSWLWRAQDADEQAALAIIPSAPQLLAERAVAWRGSGPLGGLVRRDGQDEALGLAVRATRYGCQRQGGHGRWSRAAFALLHQRFPDSPAARRTRYWFDCSHFYGGCDERRREDENEWTRWTRWGWRY